MNARSLHRALTGALVLAALLLMPAGTAQAAQVPASFVGLNDWTPPSDQTLVRTSQVGIRTWRAALFWYLIEREQGVRDWSEYDELVASAARNDTSLLMVIASCPAWACPDLAGPPRGEARDAHHAFVRDAVSRYGTDGSFWADHPELPYRPVTAWQVWNEVNAKEFWKPGPDAAAYAEFLRTEAEVIRSTDPAAKIVLSGLTDYGQTTASEFLDELYGQPGFEDSFDVLALHAYAHDAPAVGRLLDRFRGVSARHGDGDRPLWVTEFGWATTGPNAPITVTPRDQAERLRSSLDMLIGCRDRWGLERAYWFAYQDLQPRAGDPDVPGYHTGLFDVDGHAKPAWSAFGEYADGADLSPAACGTAKRGGRPGAHPDTRVRGKARTRAGKRARFRLRSSASGARFECRLYRVRGGVRRAMRGHSGWRHCRRSFSTPRLRGGRYVLRARAIDRAGRTDPTPAARRVVVKRKRHARGH